MPVTTATMNSRWTAADSMDLYNIRGWGNDFFSVNDRGHISVHPGGSGAPAIDLKELVDEVRQRGIGLPLLIRFSEIIKARVVELNEAFGRAIAEYGYRNVYRGVYPIKVNQDRYLVERLVAFGRPYHYGLEAGSKPELLAVMAMLEDEEALIVCNGYKDEEYVETALLASQPGAQRHPGGREAVRAAADPPDRRQDRRAAASRHPLAPVGPRRRALGGFGRRPLQVRAVGPRPAQRRGLPA